MFDNYKIREILHSLEIKNTYVLRLLIEVGTVDDYTTKIYKFPGIKIIEYRFNNNGVIVGYTFTTSLEVICSSWLAQVKPNKPFNKKLNTTNKIVFDNDELKVSSHTQDDEKNVGYILIPFKEKI